MKHRQEAKEVIQGRQNFLFLCVGPTDMEGGDRDSLTPGAYLLTMIGPRRAPVLWQCHALALSAGRHISLHLDRRRGEPV